MPDDRRPRRATVPGVPSIRLPELDEDVPRSVRRSHPSAEPSTNPPPALKPEYKRSFTPYDLPKLERAPLPEPEPSSRRTLFPQSIPPWARGLVAVISALSAATTGGIIVWATRAPAAKPADVVEVRTESSDFDQSQYRFLQGVARDIAVKDAITIARGCWQNQGQPFAENIVCPDPKAEDSTACQEKQLVDDKGRVIPKKVYCVVPLRWPDPRLPSKPKPREVPKP